MCPSRQDGCVCSATLLVLVHLKTTHVLYEQPSARCLWTGNAHLVDQDEPGFERLSSTFSSIISESTPPGSVRRTVPSGANSWRRLCPVKDAPPDDDDESLPGVPLDCYLHTPSGIRPWARTPIGPGRERPYSRETTREMTNIHAVVTGGVCRYIYTIVNLVFVAAVLARDNWWRLRRVGPRLSREGRRRRLSVPAAASSAGSSSTGDAYPRPSPAGSAPRLAPASPR